MSHLSLRDLDIEYDVFGADLSPPLLLVMGLGYQMIEWEEGLCTRLADRGFRVIRYDNRDVGLSTKLDAPGVPDILAVALGTAEPAYTLDEMADDGVALLDGLGIAAAHVVGVSMGGMIAQMVAAEHPSSVRSLVSIMSTTGSRWKGQPAFRIYRYLLRRAPADRDGFIERTSSLFAVIGSQGLPQDTERIREIAARSYDRGLDPAATGRQLGAIIASGDRTSQLRAISAPTLVIHGSKDRMVNRSGGVATARAIPGARMVTIEGMGHDLPEAAWSQLLDAISEHARSAERTAVAT